MLLNPAINANVGSKKIICLVSLSLARLFSALAFRKSICLGHCDYQNHFQLERGQNLFMKQVGFQLLTECYSNLT